MKRLKTYENSTTEKLSVSDIKNYVKTKRIINTMADKYFQLHKHEIDEEDFDVENMKISNVYFFENDVIIEVKDNNRDMREDFELSISDFVEFCNDPETYEATKKYNL